MGCRSAPMPRMRQAAGAPRRSAPCAVTLPPAASPRAGCVMAMPTAWTMLMSRAVVRTWGLGGTGASGGCLPHKWVHQVSCGSRSRHCPGQPAEWLEGAVPAQCHDCAGGMGMGTVTPGSALALPAVPKECSPAEFPCRSGQCVALALRCDGDRDCRDGSDEEGCAVPRPLLCRTGEVACPRSGECVPEAWRCDGAADCGDGTDEQVGGVVGTQPVPARSREGWWPCSPSALAGLSLGGRAVWGPAVGLLPWPRVHP